MRKFKIWLCNRFLPAYCREEMLSINRKLTNTITEQKAEIDRLNAYIEGMHDSMRYQRRVIVKNEVKHE